MAKPHIMYLGGGDELVPEVESLSVVPVEEEEAPGTIFELLWFPNFDYYNIGHSTIFYASFCSFWCSIFKR